MSRSEETLIQNNIQISEASQAIIMQITKPLNQRKPCHYNREFLDQYQPNETFYLSKSDRKNLYDIGFLPAMDENTYRKFRIDLSWNSSRLEGNTYSRLETENLLNQNIEALGKSPFETQMMINHKNAIDFLLSNIEAIQLNVYTIRSLHALLSNNLLSNSEASGNLRKASVIIGATPYKPPAVPQLIEDCFEMILSKAQKIKDPFEQAFFYMVHLPYLQPFIDLNKRTSRLGLNIPFLKNSLTPLSFINMPEDLYIHAILGIYELSRIELMRDLFIWNYLESVKHWS